MTNYHYFKGRYEGTNPVRGRREDIRPVGSRRRTWERLVHIDDAYGVADRDVPLVMYAEDTLTIQASWMTPSIGSFMTTYLPSGFSVSKQYNTLWVKINGKQYPLAPRERLPAPCKVYITSKAREYQDSNPKTNFYIPDYFLPLMVDGNTYKPLYETLLVKRVNRQRAAELRGRITPFVEFCTSLLRLSDGVLRWEVIKEYHPKIASDHWLPRGDYILSKHHEAGRNLKVLLSASSDDYLKILCNLAAQKDSLLCLVSRAGGPPSNWLSPGPFDVHFNTTALERFLYRLHDNDEENIYDLVETPVTENKQTNVVGYAK